MKRNPASPPAVPTKRDYIKFATALVSVIIGAVLIIVGLFGLFLPIIPGIVLVIAGIIILNRNVNITFLKQLEERLKGGVEEGVEKFREYRAKKKKEKIKK